MRVEFNEKKHLYRIDGKEVPSVTQCMDLLNRELGTFDYVSKSALDASAAFGTNGHKACALLVRDELDWKKLDPALEPYMRGLQRFLKEGDVVPITSEHIVASNRLKCAGTIDLVASLCGYDTIIDFKFTASMPVTVGVQTAGYERLYHDMHGERARRACVQLKPDDYRVYPMTDLADYAIFQSALNVAHWVKENK